MRSVGVICEYNPFHLGHARQLAQLRCALGAETALVCLMSGNYVQRGEPAIFDRQTRARAAVLAGADLVLELPVSYVLRSAEGFADGGVEILTRLGCEALGFGCECGDGAAVLRAAQATLTPEYAQQFRAQIQAGQSYAAARQQAMTQLDTDGALLARPNDILAVEYCRAILRQQSRMQPLALLRPGDYHSQLPDAEHPSAASIRRLIVAGEQWRRYVPPQCGCEGAVPHALMWGERAMLARLRALTQQDWQRAAHGSEGLWSKVWRAVQTQPDYAQILAAAKSRRYPRTRLQRLLLCAYLGLDARQLAARAPYVRVLAFTQTGQAVLRQAKKQEALTLVNAGQTPQDADFFALECRAADLYTLFSAPGTECPAGMERAARIYRKEE